MNRFLILCVALLSALTLWADEKPAMSASVLKQKGNLCYNAEQYAQALDYYTQALAKSKEQDIDSVYYACLGNIGNIYASIGDSEKALGYFQDGYKRAVESNDTVSQWKFLTNLVAIYCMLGKPDEAQAFYELQSNISIPSVSLSRYYSLSNQALIAEARHNLSLAEFLRHKAAAYVQEKQLPVNYLVAEYSKLGTLCMDSGRPQEALDWYRQCVDSLLKYGMKAQLVNIYPRMERAYTMLGDTAAAQQMNSRYIATADSVYAWAQMYKADSGLFEFENAENLALIDHLTTVNTIWIYVTVTFVVFLLTVLIFYILLRRRNRMLQEAQQTLIAKNNELMITDSKNKELLQEYIALLDEKNSGKGPAENTEQAAPESVGDAKTPEAQGSEPIGMNPEQKNRLLRRVVEVFDDVKTICDSDFSLTLLAKMVDSNTKYVSYVINDTYGKNFRSLLGEYRIREAMRRLKDHDTYGNMTMRAIYEDLGYNSAASFIQAFKRVAGMTPSAYMKLAENNIPEQE